MPRRNQKDCNKNGRNIKKQNRNAKMSKITNQEGPSNGDSSQNLPEHHTNNSTLHRFPKAKKLQEFNGKEVPPHPSARTQFAVHHFMNSERKPQGREKGKLSAVPYSRDGAPSSSSSSSGSMTSQNESEESEDEPLHLHSKKDKHTSLSGTQLTDAHAFNGFNHYQKHTRLKRQIFQMRREAFAYFQQRWREGQQPEGSPRSLVCETVLPAPPPTLTMSTPTEEQVPHSPPSFSEASARLVQQMEQIYRTMNASISAGDYRRVKSLHHALWIRRRRLRHLLAKPQPEVFHKLAGVPPQQKEEQIKEDTPCQRVDGPPVRPSAEACEGRDTTTPSLSLPPADRGKGLSLHENEKRNAEEAAKEEEPRAASLLRVPPPRLPSSSACRAAVIPEVYCSFFPDITQLPLPSTRVENGVFSSTSSSPPFHGTCPLDVPPPLVSPPPSLLRDGPVPHTPKRITPIKEETERKEEGEMRRSRPKGGSSPPTSFGEVPLHTTSMDLAPLLDQRSFQRYPLLLLPSAVEKLYRQCAMASTMTPEWHTVEERKEAFQASAGPPLPVSPEQEGGGGGGPHQAVETTWETSAGSAISSAASSTCAPSIPLPWLFLPSAIHANLQRWEDGLQQAWTAAKVDGPLEKSETSKTSKNNNDKRNPVALSPSSQKRFPLSSSEDWRTTTRGKEVIKSGCSSEVPLQGNVALPRAGRPSIHHKPGAPAFIRTTPFTNPNRTNIITDALDDLAFTTLHYLYEEQHTLRMKNPLQFKSRQRFVIGFHEVLKFLRAGRLQMVLLASDIERWEPPPSQSSATQDGKGENVEEQNEGGCSASSCSTTRVAGVNADKTPHAAPPSNIPRTISSCTKRRTFHSIGEAVDAIQAGCGILPCAKNECVEGGGSSNANPNDVTNDHKELPLCVTCLSRHSMAYALMCKGKCQVACVGIVHSDKYHYLLKALKRYGKDLANAFAAIQ